MPRRRSRPQATQALEHGIATISITPVGSASQAARSRLIVGVAPDGARKVLVHTRGSVATVPVVEGLFVLRDSVGVPSDFLTLR